jgi:hypothetical protein
MTCVTLSGGEAATVSECKTILNIKDWFQGMMAEFPKTLVGRVYILS